MQRCHPPYMEGQEPVARRHRVYGLAAQWHEVAPARVKCQAADRVTTLGTVSRIQEQNTLAMQTHLPLVRAYEHRSSSAREA